MINTYPKASLRRKSKKVKSLAPSTTKIITSLTEDLLKSAIGVGLSAPQIGENFNIFAIKDSFHPRHEGHRQEPSVRIFINPKITETFKEKKSYTQILNENNEREDFLEGCLSFPDLYGTVKRWLKIGVSYQVVDENRRLVEKSEVLENLEAIVFQHELDHLSGILFIDWAKEEGGKLFYQGKEGKLEEISWTILDKITF